jgi:hypothetical protein
MFNRLTIKKHMRNRLIKKIIFLIYSYFFCVQLISSQNKVNPLSFEAKQKKYSNIPCQYYYRLELDGQKYKLINLEKQNVLSTTYDTIMHNSHFIITVDNNITTIYRSPTIETVTLPDVYQAYLINDGLEVLTSQGARYYNNTITAITHFPKENWMKCGTVYSKKYQLQKDQKTKKYSIVLSSSRFGNSINKNATLIFNNMPHDVERVSFLNNTNHTSVSVNNSYSPFPHLVKITKEGKKGIYSYNPDEGIYPSAKKEKREYIIRKKTRDTIWKPKLISFYKEGFVRLKEVLPIIYDSIELNPDDGLVYLVKDNMWGIYPNHINTSFQTFYKKTRSFYKIVKNGKQGWVDIKTFKEYYF